MRSHSQVCITDRSADISSEASDSCAIYRQGNHINDVSNCMLVPATERALVELTQGPASIEQVIEVSALYAAVCKLKEYDGLFVSLLQEILH